MWLWPSHDKCFDWYINCYIMVHTESGKPGIVSEFSIILIQVKETNIFIISFSLTNSMAVWKVVALIVVS